MWTKILTNIGVVTVGCVVGHQIIGSGLKGLLIGLGLCYASNLGALFQDPPGKTSVPTPPIIKPAA